MLLEQRQPPSKVWAELHSPVEHMVCAVQRFVLECVLSWDHSDAALMYGVTYQQIQRCKPQCSVQWGRRACSASGDPCARCLACLGSRQQSEARRQCITVMRCARVSSAAKVGKVKGTAGGWMQDSKQTQRARSACKLALGLAWVATTHATVQAPDLCCSQACNRPRREGHSGPPHHVKKTCSSLTLKQRARAPLHSLRCGGASPGFKSLRLG